MAPPSIARITVLQSSRAAEIERIHMRFRETPADYRTRNILNGRLSSVNKIWEEARATHAEILMRDNVATAPYMVDDVFAQMEAAYESAQNTLLRALDDCDASSTRRVRAPDGDGSDSWPRVAKLPKLDLPSFSGRYEDWENFYDLFSSLVHDSPRLSDVIKLQYLKSCLTGSAADLVKDVATTNANYLTTWQALRVRYSNPRLTVNNHLTALMDLPYLKSESAEELRAFSDEAQRIVRALTNLEMPVEHWGIWFVYILASRLDSESRKLWEADLSVKDRQDVSRAAASSIELGRLERFPSFHEFVEFLEQRSHALSMIAAESKPTKRYAPTRSKSTLHSNRAYHARTAPIAPPGRASSRKCPLCNGGHYIGNCPRFQTKSPYERCNEVRRLRLCFNCLGAHSFRNCESKRRCAMCRGKHHSSIHSASFKLESARVNPAKNPDPPCSERDSMPPPGVSAMTASCVGRRYSVILATAQIELIGPRDTRVRVRAMLDQGSETSFVTQSIAQLLELPQYRAEIPLMGIGASKIGIVRTSTSLCLQSISNPSFQLKGKALILPRLTSQIPQRKLHNFDPRQFNDIALADPLFCEPGSIDVILGADIYGKILRPGVRRFPPSQLIAQDTELGWIVSGSTEADLSWRAAAASSVPLVSAHCTSDDDLNETLQRFWNTEEVLIPIPKRKPEDEACDQQFLNSHYRSPDGRYTVRLPLKSRPPPVSVETKRNALSSLSQTHRRFSRDPNLAEVYRGFMRTYEELGHMEKVPASQVNNTHAWYIPHHPIVQYGPTHRKFRVVFNASSRTRELSCLNDFLMTGPALQGDLSLILLNWRKYCYVFTADMVKMFRQIRIHPDDQDLQRILWSPDPNDPPVDYRLTTVTYGTACAPYLAIRTLAQLTSDEGTRYPLGASCLQHNTYVDDIFAGSHDLALAIKKRSELSELLHSAGIALDKWAANHPELVPLSDGTNHRGVDKLIDTTETVMTVASRWSPVTDAFGFSVTNMKPVTIVPTKRSILSCISRLFDPLGWLAPITITAKILMQDLWILKCGWDSPVPPEISQRWSKYSESVASVSAITMNRWLGTTATSDCQIHGFADASSRAYAAVVYLRVTNDAGRCQVSILMAKSKVSPVKTMSIPNLELNAAYLLVKLVCHLKTLSFFKKLPVYAWSDSQIVLAWLRKHPCHWKTFVANRVSFIQTELPSAEWRHISTKDNPADLATRGAMIKPTEFGSVEVWWHGPDWLASPSEDWPVQSETLHACHSQTQPMEPAILTQFSSLTRLIRVVAYCRRPLVNLRKRRNGGSANVSFLTSLELSDARLAVIRLAQANSFQSEIALLTTKGTLPKRNPLRKLNPFIGEEDRVLRVGGRLVHADLSHETKHPPILSQHSALSRLFVHHAHVSSLHGGLTLTLSIMLQHVWVLGRSRLVKAEIRNCTTCQRVKPRLVSQLMGGLPKDRVTPARPFTNSGLDYAGPIQVRTTKGRGHRSYNGYIALFVCFVTRAIHLEVVSDLTTASFLAAYRRFAGRRGVCRHLYSDNGTTFQGAARELRKMFDAASDFYGDVATVLANEGTDWTFIPPNTPHCGGLWEAGVKSVKHHLRRTIGDHQLTFEELSTVLVDIEACLNSRPLSALTNDLDDLSALTPAHFLVGGPLRLHPEGGIPVVPENRLTRFQLLQRIRNNFWKRWSTEYLHHLQERSKWRDPSENFSRGQLVLVQDARYPPSKWPLGRVIEVHPGPDGLVRVVTVKTATSTLRRHIVRLSPLSLPTSDASAASTEERDS